MISRFLAFFDRRGTTLLASGLFIGLILQPVARAIWPLLPTLVFLLTAATLLRIDWPQVIAHARHPLRIGLSRALGARDFSPCVIAAIVQILGLPTGLAEALVLWAASPPLMALPAIAVLLGLDAALALLVMIAATFLVPLTLPPLLLGLMGLDLGIGIGPLMARLAVFVGGAGAAAGLLRWAPGARAAQAIGYGDQRDQRPAAGAVRRRGDGRHVRATSSMSLCACWAIASAPSAQASACKP